ncbi:conserved hypothetical protein [Gloeothece citriformis PCC 7424]|uniref:Cytochrome c domain-containing protein n=1 Tax=Gloeothece citriformis (strain PCC 7424) TaxID=65393 RepID=B7K9E2_GLOC7|nr:hypothetical protein [Gloeothece citriformis]ACK68625.1 conserved hypothetical protein [Gloeothece citriformis PCC 7424]
MRWYKRAFLFFLLIIMSLIGFVLSHLIRTEPSFGIQDLLAPAPTQKVGNYDYFGTELEAVQATQLVREQGLNPNDPTSYQRLGMVQITPELIQQGEDIFFDRKIGDTFGFQGILGFGKGLSILEPEINQAIFALGGQPTSNLMITLLKDLNVGGITLPAGSKIPTGFDVPKNGTFPIGLKPNGNITCAVCHDTLSEKGELLKGVPNGDLAIGFLIALAPNSNAGFIRINPVNFKDPKLYKLGTGKTIIDSQGNHVKLPDPETLERLFDQAVLSLPFGNFESSLDFISNTTQIPTVFTFGTRPYLVDGQFAIGPFGGLSGVNNSVHSSEVNLVGNRELIQAATGLDPEVYLGILLQNAADERLRLPYDNLKPSEWLRAIAPDPLTAELEDQIPAPGTQIEPNLINPTVFTYNGLIFSPDTNNSDDIASGLFLFANNAMSAWQNSLTSPPNLSRENSEALANGSVERGARVFQQAGCVSCHTPPFFSDNIIHPVDELKTNPARGEARLALNNLLVPPKLYTFNTPVPIPSDAEVLNVPTEGISESPTTLPKGILPKGGYNTPSLIGLYLTAPYLHDGGVAVGKDALKINDDGSYTIVDPRTTDPPNQWGLTGTLARFDVTPDGQIDISKRILPDSANSLRALLDRRLRHWVIKANKANPGLRINNLDGTGHEFYVDPSRGFSYGQQSDLVNFLLALDEDPAHFWPRSARE